MAPNKVVVKFKDSTVVKGKTSDFFPNKAQFHLEEINGEISEISIEDLKAVFFVKDFICASPCRPSRQNAFACLGWTGARKKAGYCCCRPG